MSRADSPVRVLLVDDQDLVRSGVRMILESAGILVVGEAADGGTGIELASSLRPDVVLMDLRMGRVDGLQATRAIVGVGAARVIVLTTFELDEYLFGALRAGASGFLLKDAPRAELIRAVEVVAAGDGLLSPQVTRRLIERFGAQMGAPEPDAAVTGLTGREREVLTLLAGGRSNAEIAARLVVAEATVKTHVSSLLGKLELRDRVQAVVWAYENGLVRPGGRPPDAGPRSSL